MSNNNIQIQDPTSIRKKLQEKLQLMNSRRTGVERRKAIESAKMQSKLATEQKRINEENETKSDKTTKSKKNGGLNKNVARTLAKDGIRQVLEKFGVNDPQVEKDILNELLIGHITSGPQIAEIIMRKIQQLKSTTTTEDPSSTQLLASSSPSTTTDSSTTTEPHTTTKDPTTTTEPLSSPSSPPHIEHRKQLKHPSQTLLYKIK